MKLDLGLLKRLLVIDHPSRQEYPMISFIMNECYKIGGLEFEMDAYNNIFITKNTTNPDYYVGVVAHIDCVLPHKNKEVKIKDGKIYGRDLKTGKRIGLGMDDANGICVAIQLLREMPDLKVCFTTEEEVGFLGATEAVNNLEFWLNVSYMIQADRHGSSDLITWTNGIYSASEEWLQEVTWIAAKYGYSEQMGIGTDVGELAGLLQISGVNISCGYVSEHTNNEYTVISHLQKCLDFMEEIIKEVPTDRQYTIPIKWQRHNANYRSFEEYVENSYPDDAWELPCDHCKHNYDCMNCTENFY